MDPFFPLLPIEMSTMETTDTQRGERTGCMRIPYVSENKGIVLLIVNCIFPGIPFCQMQRRTWNDDWSLLREGHRQLRWSHFPSRSPSVSDWLSDCGVGLEHRVGHRNLSVIETEGSNSECRFANREYGKLRIVYNWTLCY